MSKAGRTTSSPLATSVPADERLTWSVAEAARLLGISVPAAYAYAADGTLPVIRLGGGRLLVPKVGLERLLMSAGA
jgi:excisionase family DNA binding protein